MLGWGVILGSVSMIDLFSLKVTALLMVERGEAGRGNIAFGEALI